LGLFLAPKGVSALPFRSRKISRFRRTVAWLAVAAFTWSSGQGAALSAALQLAGLDGTSAWHCIMMPGGSMPTDANMAMSMADDAPMDPNGPMKGGDHGFCPVCSLTGCSTPSVVAQAEFQVAPQGQHYLDAVRHPAAAPYLTAVYAHPRTRAPPLSA